MPMLADAELSPKRYDHRRERQDEFGVQSSIGM